MNPTTTYTAPRRHKCIGIHITDLPVAENAEPNVVLVFDFVEVLHNADGTIRGTLPVDSKTISGVDLTNHPHYAFVRQVLGAMAYDLPVPPLPEG
jgi:hypothetical protein